MALADVYDALTSRRVYKGALSHEVAKSIILEERGKKFAPQLVDAFLEVESEFIATCNSLSDASESEVLLQGNPSFHAEA